MGNSNSILGNVESLRINAEKQMNEAKLIADQLRRQQICQNANDFVRGVANEFIGTAVNEDKDISIYFNSNGELSLFDNSNFNDSDGKEINATDIRLGDNLIELNKNDNSLIEINMNNDGSIINGKTFDLSYLLNDPYNNPILKLYTINCDTNTCTCTFNLGKYQETIVIPEIPRVATKSG